MINFKELSGVTLKNALFASRVRKSYENKHKDGSGNFGFVIVYEKEGMKDIGCGMQTKNEHWFQLSGNYTMDKTCYGMDFGDYARPIHQVQTDWIFTQLIDFMRRFIVDNDPELAQRISEGIEKIVTARIKELEFAEGKGNF